MIHNVRYWQMIVSDPGGSIIISSQQTDGANYLTSGQAKICIPLLGRLQSTLGLSNIGASNTMNHKQHGFTLIELMITIAVMAILLTLALPSFNDFIAKRRLIGAGEAVYGQFQFARGVTLADAQDIYIHVTPGDSWRVGVTDKASCDSNTANDCTIDTVTRVTTAEDFPDITLTTNLGANDSGFVSPRATAQENGNVTLTHTVLGHSLKLLLSNLGRITICSDDLSEYHNC
jgi:type IV fimbrial biogenesis protein FimT